MGGEHPPEEEMGIVQQTTGIPGLDEILNCGIPKHTLTLLAGTSGTGKTISSFQWLFDGVKKRRIEFYDVKVLDKPRTSVRGHFEHKKFVHNDKFLCSKIHKRFCLHPKVQQTADFSPQMTQGLFDRKAIEQENVRLFDIGGGF